MSDTTITSTSDNPEGSPPATPQGDNGGKPEPTFSQAELNKIAAQRAKEAQERERKKLLEDTGLDSMDSLMTLIADAKKRKESELSELEKAQAQIDAANKKAQEAITAKEALEKQILDSNHKAAFLKAVQENGGSQVEDLYILVQAKRSGDYAQVFGEDATADEAKMKALIKEVQAAFPHYFGTSGAGSPSANGGIAPTSLQRATEEAKKDIEKKFGKL